ncbi:helix-turn-helix domain-containing protein [Coprobacter fastidiosus]|uniref:Helix-turn-helix domain-containing protein n=1 Tax=Candidatus Mediterraneibacter stercoravium TaxID=2838685 RepID=A0A9D2G7R3_9FIRM|nr:helix-turn-helix domain-containing protein [Candidatus Mediterraneibacter stercoravium]
MIDYSPLWMTMKEKHISQYYLLQHGVDNRTLNSLKKNKNITLLTLEKLCRLLDCTPNDVVAFSENKEP